MTTTAGGGQALHTFSLMLLSYFIRSNFLSDLTVESRCIPAGVWVDLNLKYGPNHKWWFWAM